MMPKGMKVLKVQCEEMEWLKDESDDCLEVSNVSHASDVIEFPLNYDCMYEVFQRLGRLQDLMNLVESYEDLWKVADWIYKRRYNGITIDFKRCLHIKRIMDHVGPFVKSLALKLTDQANYTVENLVRIQQTCTKLEHLAIIEFDRSVYKDNHPFKVNFSNTLESLFLSYCDLANDDKFFDCFTILNSLTMLGCDNISVSAMQRCFERNQQIESFACNSRTLDYSQFLHLLPKLKRLGIPYDSRLLEPNFLSPLQSLRSLALDCSDENVKDVLLGISLNVQNNLEELELDNVQLDTNTFEILATFSQLHRLIINTRLIRYELLETDKLPPKIKHLVLSGFLICKRRFYMLTELGITEAKFFRCTYVDLNGDTVKEWIEKYNDREERKVHAIYSDVIDPIQTITATITLSDFTPNNFFPYNLSRVAFLALNSRYLIDIEPEVDAYTNNPVDFH